MGEGWVSTGVTKVFFSLVSGNLLQHLLSGGRLVPVSLRSSLEQRVAQFPGRGKAGLQLKINLKRLGNKKWHRVDKGAHPGRQQSVYFLLITTDYFLFYTEIGRAKSCFGILSQNWLNTHTFRRQISTKMWLFITKTAFEKALRNAVPAQLCSESHALILIENFKKW